MKVFLLSDTHSHIDDDIMRHVSWADQVWHAGDIGNIAVTDQIQSTSPLRCVYGNIDGLSARTDFSLELKFEISGMKFYMTHIGGRPGRYAKGIRSTLNELQPDVFICGHSHILKVMRDPSQNLLYLNPGAAGIHGFHKVRTALRFEIVDGRIINMEAIEFYPRRPT
jgi:hypothetical protein